MCQLMHFHEIIVHEDANSYAFTAHRWRGKIAIRFAVLILLRLSNCSVVTSSGTMTNTYTIDEVARHNNAKDLWIVIHGAIYDITAFHKEHPGGEEVLLELAGQDATECFDSIGHSYEAINLRETLKVGELVTDLSSSKSKTTTTEVKEPVEDDWQYQEPKEEMKSWHVPIIYVAVAIYAIVIYYWFSKM